MAIYLIIFAEVQNHAAKIVSIFHDHDQINNKKKFQTSMHGSWIKFFILSWFKKKLYIIFLISVYILHVCYSISNKMY